jgi:hypothetical protein
MNRKFPVLIVSILVIGCSSSPNTLQRAHDIPIGRVQKIEERGLLPIGRIVAIEQKPKQEIIYDTKRPENKSLSFGEFLVLPFLPIILFTGDLISLFLPDKSPDNDARSDHIDEKPNHKNGIGYRHVIRVIGAEEDVIRDEIFSFKVGDCVALRPSPEKVVVALPDLCE